MSTSLGIYIQFRASPEDGYTSCHDDSSPMEVDSRPNSLASGDSRDCDSVDITISIVQ